MLGADRSANFVVKAKDAATGPLSKIGFAMGKLKGAASAAFRGIATGAAIAGAAIAGLTIASIKGAVEDELAQARLVATLRARGKATEENLAKVQEAIKAGQELAFTDDQVRAGIETATQFTNNFSKALKIQRVAQDLAVAKGIDLETATRLVGQAFAGSGRGLKKYGIELQRTVYWTETKEKKDRKGVVTEEKVQKSRKETIDGMAAVNLVMEKYGGIAEEVANTNAFQLQVAQIKLNEAFESFGARFLPVVAEGLKFFNAEVLPKVEEGLAFLGDKIFDVGAEITKPGGMLESVSKVTGEIVESFRPELEAAGKSLGELFDSVVKLIGTLWGDGEGALAFAFKALGLAIEAAFALAKPFFDALTWLVNNVTKVIDAIQKISGARQANSAAVAAGAGYGGGSFVNPLNRNGMVGGFTANLTVNLDGKTIAQSTDSYLGRQYASGSSRVTP